MVRHFLVIDDNPDARFLITKTLLRKFPKSVTQECEDAEVALTLAADPRLTVIVVHRLWDVDGASMVRRLRAVNPTVPIVAVSGMNRAIESLAAGASAFLLYDEWLRIGTLVAELLGVSDTVDTSPPFATVPPQSAPPFDVTGQRN